MNNYIISSDLYRFSQKKGILNLISTCKYPSFRYMLIIRLLAQMSRYNPIKLVLLLLKRRHMFKYSFQISEKTKIGSGFYINHFGTIVIGNPGKSIRKNNPTKNYINNKL